MAISSNILFLIIGGFVGLGFGLILSSLHGKTKRQIEGGPHRQTTFVFSGNLSQTNLLDAIQFLELGRRQGVLHVFCHRRKGYLTFVDGKVADAFYRNQNGREAIYPMLDLVEGEFYFEPKDILQPRIIDDSLMDLVFLWDERKKTVS